MSKEAKGLGELKLDTIREALRQDNAILVQGATDWKVIRYDQVWKNDNRDVRGPARPAGRPPSSSPRFAGEQLHHQPPSTPSSSRRKPKVCFVRAGGPPLSSGYGGAILVERCRPAAGLQLRRDRQGRHRPVADASHAACSQPAAPEPSRRRHRRRRLGRPVGASRRSSRTR